MPSPTSRIDMFLHLRNMVYPAFVVLAGVELDLFTALAERPQTTEELATTLDVNADKLRAILYVLVQAAFLTVDNGRFANAPDAATFLVRSSDQYIGEMIKDLRSWWTPVLQAADTVRTGRAQAKVDYAGFSQEELEAQYRSFYEQSVVTGRALTEHYDFSTYQHMLDVGGGTGAVTIAITAACPNLRATIVDLPTVTPVTQRFVAEASSADRIRVVSADVINQPLEGHFDVAVMSAFMPVLGAEQIRRALQHVSRVMSPGGTLYVTDAGILDDSRLAPELVVHNNLWFINVFDEGCAHTEGERKTWLTENGFQAIERNVLPNQWGVMVARKL